MKHLCCRPIYSRGYNGIFVICQDTLVNRKTVLSEEPFFLIKYLRRQFSKAYIFRGPPGGHRVDPQTAG